MFTDIHRRLPALVSANGHQEKFDSAGRAHLELSGPPVTVIGGANGDPEYDLTFAYGVALLSDGRVATLSLIGNRFYLFGADGQGQRTLSRPGKGPGELLRPSGAIRLPGDTIFVADDGNRSLSWFTADKGVVRSKARPANGDAELARVHGVLRNGGVLMSSAGLVQGGVPDKFTRPPADIGLVFPDGRVQVISSIPDLEVIKMNMVMRGESRPETRVIGFSRGAIFAAWDTNVVTGSGNGYQLDIRNSAGTVHARIVIAQRRRVTTAAMRNASIQRTMDRYRTMKGEGGRLLALGEIERIERSTPFADSLPPYSSIGIHYPFAPTLAPPARAIGSKNLTSDIDRTEPEAQCSGMKPTVYSPPKPLADAERDYLSALEYLLRCAVMVGRKEPGAVVKAKRARQLYNAAVIEVRRSERQAGRTGSIHWIHSQLGVAQHSSNARGPGDIDYVETVERALESLRKATW